MLLSTKQLPGYAVEARDGNAGTVEDLLFDNRARMLLFLVVDTGLKTMRNRVLVPLRTIKRVDGRRGAVELRLEKQQVHKSPDLAGVMPDAAGGGFLSVLQDLMVSNWNSTWGLYEADQPCTEEPVCEGTVCSLREALGTYRLETADGEAGMLSDIVVEDERWEIDHLVVTPDEGAGDRAVLIEPADITFVSSERKTIQCELRREALATEADVLPHGSA